MDSVSQLVLGSTVGHVIGAKTLGRKALIWGAIIGTLPDLDIIISPLLNDVERVIYHRGITHAFFWQALASPFFALIIAIIHRQFQHYLRWLLIVLLGFFTHSLLDWLTIYGTYLFLPFNRQPQALGSLFIIDPLFTLPLLIAFLIGLFKPQQPRTAVIALLLSCSYVLTAWGVQQHVTQHAISTLKNQGIRTQNTVVSPMPFSILWWRIIAIDDSHWYEGVQTLWDNQQHTLNFSQPIRFIKRNRNLQLLPYTHTSWSVDKLNQFSQGFYQLKKITHKDTTQIIYSNLRMGFGNQLVFSYAIAEKWQGEWRLIEPAEKVSIPYRMESLRHLFKRYF